MTTTTEFNEADLPPLGKLQVPLIDADDISLSDIRIIARWAEKTAREYALAAVTTYHKKLTEQQPVFEVGFGWLDDATKYPRGTKLYATPMLQDKPDGFIHPDNVRRLQSGETVAFRKKPYEHDGGGLPVYVGAKPQANELEAVKALRRVVSNYEMNCSIRDAWAWHEDSYKVARAVLAGEAGARGEPETMEEIHRQERERPYAPVIPVNPHDPIQPKQAQAMDEREEFEVWLRSIKHPVLPLWQNGIPYGDGQMQRLWGYWQARAALAQAQASGKTVDAIDYVRGGPFDWETGGKAAPSDEQIRAIAVCDGGLLQDDDSAAWTASDPALLKFARALLERYGK